MGTTYKSGTPDRAIGRDSQTDASSGELEQTTGSRTLGRYDTVTPYLAVAGATASPEQGRSWGGVFLRILVGVGSIILLVLGWWGVALLGNYPPWILPTPGVVADRMWSMALDGSLWGHVATTSLEAGLGFLLAIVIGLALGYFIARSSLLERIAAPYIAVTQALPVVAIAPLLVIWLKQDLLRNVVIVALIVFFPILVNTIVGMRSIDRSMREVARISGANWLQTLLYVELPLGLRALLGGIRLGLALSLTGAVVGELVSSSSGLGFLLILGRGLFDTPLIFVGLVSLAVLATLLYTIVSLLEKVLITWE